MYLVSGQRNIQAIFRVRPGIEDETMMQMAMEYTWGMTKEDIAKFANDRTGRGVSNFRVLCQEELLTPCAAESSLTWVQERASS